MKRGLTVEQLIEELQFRLKYNEIQLKSKVIVINEQSQKTHKDLEPASRLAQGKKLAEFVILFDF